MYAANSNFSIENHMAIYTNACWEIIENGKFYVRFIKEKNSKE